jgi:hypothetical protein
MPHSRGFLTLLVLLAGVGAGIAYSLTPAQAVTCSSGTLATNYQPDANSRGVKVLQLMVYNPDTSCGRVNSVLITNSSETDFVEIGYYENQNYYLCLDNTTGAPHVEAFEANSTGNSCAHSTASLTAGATPSFSVSNPAQDGFWTFLYNGNPIFTNAPSEGTFTNGITLNNGERGCTCDVAKADFVGLQRMGPNNNWVDWSGTALSLSFGNNDSGYKGCKYSSTHTSVILSSSSC